MLFLPGAVNARLTDLYKDTTASQPKVENLTRVSLPLPNYMQRELQLDGALTPAVSIIKVRTRYCSSAS